MPCGIIVQKRTLGIVAAFLAVYVIWGSTYLAIRFAVQDLPPFLMAGARWLVAGVLVVGWRLAAGDALPTWRETRDASIVGLALIVGGNGLVSWAEQWVPSALTALLIAIVPVWIALLAWLRSGERPSARVSLGILLGFAGVATLFAPALRLGVSGASALLIGTIVILVASLSWASGSLYSRGAKPARSTMMAVGVQMLVGGVALTILGLGVGEAPRVHLAAVSLRTWISFGFLAIFGSIVAFSAYIWLLKQVPAPLVATYAFVNPIVAVILGALLAHEALTRGAIVASGLIVVGIALVVTAPRPAAPASPGPAGDPQS